MSSVSDILDSNYKDHDLLVIHAKYTQFLRQVLANLGPDNSERAKFEAEIAKADKIHEQIVNLVTSKLQAAGTDITAGGPQIALFRQVTDEDRRKPTEWLWNPWWPWNWPNPLPGSS